MKDTLIISKSEEKREKLKGFSLEIVNKLESLDIKASFHPLYVSPYGHTRTDFEQLIDRLKSCNEDTEYLNTEKVHVLSGDLEEVLKPFNTNSCHNYSICPVCSSIKRNKLVEQIKPYIKTLSRIPGIYIYAGTITIQGTTDPGRDYDHLRNSWTRFVKMGQRRKSQGDQGDRRSAGEASKFLGSVLSIEVIPEQDRQDHYHVHGHLLIIANSPLNYVVYDPQKKAALKSIFGDKIPKNVLDSIALKKISIPNNEDQNLIYQDIAVSKLSEEWYTASGGINFWIHPIKNQYDNSDQNIEKNLYEIIKYECKPWELSAMQILNVWDSIHGKRRITFSGIFTNNKYYQEKLKSILEQNNLYERFKDYRIDYFEEVKRDLYYTVKKLFTFERYKYETTIEYKDMTYTEQPEYRDFLRRKMAHINRYRVESNRHKKSLFLARQMLNNADRLPCVSFEGYKEVSRRSLIAWIEKKNIIKERCLTLIREEHKNIKAWIANYQDKRAEFRKKTEEPETEPLKIPLSPNVLILQ